MEVWEMLHSCLWTGSNVINYAFFSCSIHIAMKASIFVLPANTRPFFLSSLSESHNSVLNLLGMSKYSVYNRARKCDYLRISLSISALEARRDTLTFGSVFREVPLLEGGTHVVEPNICFFIRKMLPLLAISSSVPCDVNVYKILRIRQNSLFCKWCLLGAAETGMIVQKIS